MLNDILNNPVRIYNVLIAALALTVYYVPSLPEPLILGLVAALCGVGGEVVRGSVTPMRKVNAVIGDAVASQVADKPKIDVKQPDSSPTVTVVS